MSIQATTADVRAGDRFTSNGTQYIAVLDAKPQPPSPRPNGMPPLHWITFVLAAGKRLGPDGVMHLDSSDGQNMVSDYPITIDERGIRIELRGMQTAPADLTDEPEQETWWERDVARHSTRRAAADKAAADEARHLNSAIRNALRADASVARLCELTGLSRERIYQIRDGRR